MSKNNLSCTANRKKLEPAFVGNIFMNWQRCSVKHSTTLHAGALLETYACHTRTLYVESTLFFLLCNVALRASPVMVSQFFRMFCGSSCQHI